MSGQKKGSKAKQQQQQQQEEQQQEERVKSIAVGRVVAAFYPKFENESADYKVKQNMVQLLKAESAEVEVSLKHSGSLLLWAGKQAGAFAKNSFGNKFTAVGLWVVAKTLSRAWGEEGAERLRELNAALELQCLCVGFELVTSCLGDHGQRPLHDYVVVTSIADLSSGCPYFFSTADLIKFCRHWRLPHNCYWMFRTSTSLNRLFSLYASCHEEGTAATVPMLLSQIADVSVPGMLDHLLAQGNILEGLVSRVVPHASCRQLLAAMSSHGIEGIVAADAAPFTAGQKLRSLVKPGMGDEQIVALLVEQLDPAVVDRRAWKGCRAGEDSDGEIESSVASALRPSASSSLSPSPSSPSPSSSSETSSLTQADLLSEFTRSKAADESTASLQHLIRAAQHELKRKVNFKVSPSHHRAALSFLRVKQRLQERGGGEGAEAGGGAWQQQLRESDVAHHFIITVHVVSDAAFRRFTHVMQDDSSLWPLFRGFFIEAWVLRVASDSTAVVAAAPAAAALHMPSSAATAAGERQRDDEGRGQKGSALTSSSSLMLKMKFVPYKLRTFLLRNGLRDAKTDRQKYRQYCKGLLTTWGVSPASQKVLSSLCERWASYVTSAGIDVDSDRYLDHAECFLQWFAKKGEVQQRAVGGDEGQEEVSWVGPEKGRWEEEDARLQKLEEEEEEEVKRMKATSRGLFIFFPAMPGCGKSDLSQWLVDHALGDGRPIESIMGDQLPDEVKYWPHVKEELQNRKGVLNFIADKNAPRIDVWQKVVDICCPLQLIAAPVVPVSRGTQDNPFDLQLLALFLFRVLNRSNHPGSLDSDSKNPATVLLLFHSLYDGMSRAQFESHLKFLFGVIVAMPVIRPDAPPLPPSIVNLLKEGKQLRRRTNMSGSSRKDPLPSPLLHWEAAVKAAFQQHRGHFESIQVPRDEVMSAVKQQLHDIASGKREDIEKLLHQQQLADRVRKARYAAIVLERGDVKRALEELVQSDAAAAPLLAQPLQWLEDPTRSPFHVTLAHYREHGLLGLAEMVRWEGSIVEVKLREILSDGDCAALAVDWETSADSVACRNPFPHITIWTAPKVEAMSANKLPEEAKRGEAARHEIKAPLMLKGTVQFV